MGYIISIIGLGGILGALLTQKLKQFQYGWIVCGGMVLMGIGFGDWFDNARYGLCFSLFN